jgi:hypothetical protein
MRRCLKKYSCDCQEVYKKIHIKKEEGLKK